MRQITVGDNIYKVDKFYKQGASAFFSTDGAQNPYRFGSQRSMQWSFGFCHAKENIITKEVSESLIGKNTGDEMSKEALQKELAEYQNKIPAAYAKWDYCRTSAFKKAHKEAMSKKNSPAHTLETALRALRTFYKD